MRSKNHHPMEDNTGSSSGSNKNNKVFGIESIFAEVENGLWLIPNDIAGKVDGSAKFGIDAQVPGMNDKPQYGGTITYGLEGKTTVNRKDWGVNWNTALEAGGVLVSEKVTLEFDVSAIRSADA